MIREDVAPLAPARPLSDVVEPLSVPVMVTCRLFVPRFRGVWFLDSGDLGEVREVVHARKGYPPEFRREAVRLLRRGDRSVPELARDLGVSQQSLRNWSRQLDVDDGRQEGLRSDEREELRRLRRENRILQEEREILKKAAAFFAKDSEIR